MAAYNNFIELSIKSISMKKNQLALTTISKLFLLASFNFILGTQIVMAQKFTSTDSIKKYDANYYRKYKTVKSIAWVSASAGVVALAIGLSEPFPKYYINSDPTLGFPNRKGKGLRIAGSILGFGSIPLFIIAHRNKRKAFISLKAENIDGFKQNIYITNYCALALNVRL